MILSCASSLAKRHRDHLKEEKKKDKNIKHICTEECQAKEREAHRATHDWYESQK